MIHYKGLIAAGFSPMDREGNLAVGTIPSIVEHLIAEGISGIYVCGSTGEGPSLSVSERKKVAQAYSEAVNHRIPVIVQVGHDSLAEARDLAKHARQIGADAISAVPPHYYKMDSVDTLVSSLAYIASAVPRMPMFYYHVPTLSGITLPMRQFLDAMLERVPNFAGVKYSAVTVHEFQDCLEYTRGRCQLFFGCDEMLLSALSAGSCAAIGSTYNFAAPLYHGIIDAFEKGDTQRACKLQSRSVALCRLLHQYRGPAAIKAMMKFIGIDCGPVRLPLKALTEEESACLYTEVGQSGFFEWGRKQNNLSNGSVRSGRTIRSIEGDSRDAKAARRDNAVTDRKQ